MTHASPSALIIDQGERVLLRLQRRLFEVTQKELRTVLGLPAGPAGLGISIDDDQFHFEFTADDQTIEMSARQLHRRLAKQMAPGAPGGSNIGD
jgi:hypothetical protein